MKLADSPDLLVGRPPPAVAHNICGFLPLTVPFPPLTKIKLSFGKDTLFSFIKNLSQRHLGFESVGDTNQEITALTKMCNHSPLEPCKPAKQLRQLYQDTIISFLGSHWHHLSIHGLFGASLRETVPSLDGTTRLPHEQQRGYHDILRALGKVDSLNSLRRVVAEIRSLQCYTRVLEEVQLRCGRKRGESAKNLAHKVYIRKVFPDATAESLKIHHANFKSDLQSARRWVLMIEGYQGKGGAGLGLILAASKSLISFINNKSQVTHEELLEQLQRFTNNALAMEICQILNQVAQVLLQYHKLP
ncbi:hypothetical protein V2G26_018292 [Clonostachys chloroleuca]